MESYFPGSYWLFSYAGFYSYGFVVIIDLGSALWICLYWVDVLYFGSYFFSWFSETVLTVYYLSYLPTWLMWSPEFLLFFEAKWGRLWEIVCCSTRTNSENWLLGNRENGESRRANLPGLLAGWPVIELGALVSTSVGNWDTVTRRGGRAKGGLWDP